VHLLTAQEDYDGLMEKAKGAKGNKERLDFLIAAEKVWLDSGWNIDSWDYSYLISGILFSAHAEHLSGLVDPYLPKAERATEQALAFSSRIFLTYPMVLAYNLKGDYERAGALSKTMYDECDRRQTVGWHKSMVVLFGLQHSEALINLGLFSEAITILERLINLAPSIPPEDVRYGHGSVKDPAQYVVETCLALAFAYAEVGKFESAYRYLDEAEKADEKVLMDKTFRGMDAAGHIGPLYGLDLIATRIRINTLSGKQEDLEEVLGRVEKFTKSVISTDRFDNVRFRYHLAEFYFYNGAYTQVMQNLEFSRTLLGREKTGDMMLDGKIGMLKGRTAMMLPGNLLLAIAAFESAKTDFERLDYRNGMVDALTGLAKAQLSLKNYAGAVSLLRSAVALIESNLPNASGRLKRDYAARQSDVYAILAMALVADGKHGEALLVFEQARARYLKEQLGATVTAESTKMQVQTALGVLDEKTAVVEYCVAGDDIIVWVIRKSSVKAAIISCARIVEAFKSEFPDGPALLAGEATKRISGLNRGLTIESRPGAGNAVKVSLEDCISLYVRLLGDPGTGTYSKASGFLYTALLENGMENELAKADRILFIPDSYLGMIPFETLMHDGKYLIEDFSVYYAPSLCVLSLLTERIFPIDRPNMIGFGDPTYPTGIRSGKNGPMSSAVETNRYVLDQMYDDFLNDPESKGTKQFFDTIGPFEMSPLPGTKAELTAIKKLYPTTRTVYGIDVSKNNFITLAGKSTHFRYIHLAAHGISFADYPELSALVLSSRLDQELDEDSYLTAKEVGGMNLKADLVTLSACETGLGRVFKGEGIVGLTYAFLAGGANSVAASLWSVSDEVTAAFMESFYLSLKSGNGDFATSLAGTKKDFIAGTKYGIKYEHPFYWAPFVLYGKKGELK